MRSQILNSRSEGFSLIELLIAMTITLVVMGIASTLIASAFHIRDRENQKSDALADTQRALNIMSREIANAGFNLNTNGIVAADSGASSIRVRSNLNKFDITATEDSRDNVQDPGEDIRYFISAAENTTYLARYDPYAGTLAEQKTVLANRIDSFNIHYFDQRVSYTANPEDIDITNPSVPEVAASAARYIVIAVAVNLEEVGTPGSPGYQPESRVLLVSDVSLRNNALSVY
jgi:prepilin-type N-terminal cleavage/methylation domain-containing protein